MSTSGLQSRRPRAWLHPSASLRRAAAVPSITVLQRVLWSLTALHAAAAALLPLLAGRDAPLPGIAPPWWLVALGLCVLELAIVHVHLGGQAHTFSLGEIGLIVALFVLPPVQALTAHLAASTVSLLLQRHQGPLEAAYNLAHLALSIVLAALVLRLALPTDPLAGGPGWLAVLATVATCTAVSDLAVTAAVAVYDWRRPARGTARILAVSQVAALAAGTIGFIAVRGLAGDPVLLGLVVVPTGLLYATSIGWVSVNEQAARVACLAEAGRLLARITGNEEAVADLLTMLRRTLRARLAALVLLSDDADEPMVRHIAVAGPGDAVDPSVTTPQLRRLARLQ